MIGNPLGDFIAFDRLFNGNSSGGSSLGDDDNHSNWALVITVIIFVLIFIFSCWAHFLSGFAFFPDTAHWFAYLCEHLR